MLISESFSSVNYVAEVLILTAVWGHSYCPHFDMPSPGLWWWRLYSSHLFKIKWTLVDAYILHTVKPWNHKTPKGMTNMFEFFTILEISRGKCTTSISFVGEISSRFKIYLIFEVSIFEVYCNYVLHWNFYS